MSDNYQSTDRKSQDTNPETPRLLAEGIIDLPVSYFQAVTGGYQNVLVDGNGDTNDSSIEITELNDLGNRVKGFNPQSLEVRIWHTNKTSGGGQVDDYFKPVPYTEFNNFSTGEVDAAARFYVHNVYVIAGQSWASYLTVLYFNRTQPTAVQSFAYKIYSTIYEFTDT